MKSFNLQRQFMGFLLPGAQSPSPHNLPWSLALAMATSLQLYSTRCGWQHQSSDTMAVGPSAPISTADHPVSSCCPCGCLLCRREVRAHAPARHVAVWGRQHGPFVHKPPGNHPGLNWHLKATPIPSQRIKLFFLVACWCSEGEGAPARASALSSWALVICSQPGRSRLPCCGAGSLSGLHRCLQVLPATAQSSVTFSFPFFFLFCFKSLEVEVAPHALDMCRFPDLRLS